MRGTRFSGAVWHCFGTKFFYRALISLVQLGPSLALNVYRALVSLVLFGPNLALILHRALFLVLFAIIWCKT